MAKLQVRIEPILPPADFIGNKGIDVINAIEKALVGDVADLLTSELETRAMWWKNKPQFRVVLKPRVTQVVLDIMPSDGKGKKIWTWVSGGVKRHYISAKRSRPTTKRVRGGKGFLFIRGGVGGYSARTGPGDVYGGPGTYAGGSFSTRVVNHPGIAPREFEKNVMDKNLDKVISIINDEVNKVIGFP